MFIRLYKKKNKYRHTLFRIKSIQTDEIVLAYSPIKHAAPSAKMCLGRRNTTSVVRRPPTRLRPGHPDVAEGGGGKSLGILKLNTVQQ